MKNLFLQSVILIVTSLLITSSLLAQSPQGIPYQAVMRNADGTVMASSAVNMTFMIHDGTASGTIVYQESHALTSNAQGLVSCVVGNGVVSQGNFAEINWGNGAKFLHVMMGSVDLGTQQMLSVPYALYAGSTNLSVSPTGDTLTVGGQSVIVPGISAANPPSLFDQGSGVTDIDGNFYPSIIINGQEWMQQNLAVTKYRNGDPIPTGLSDATWQSTTSGAYAIYNNDAANNTLYGKLYNWFAVNDSRGLCPTGWHVPSDSEWTLLINFLDFNQNPDIIGTQSAIAGGKMKSITGWNLPNTGATNQSGFFGLPGGSRASIQPLNWDFYTGMGSYCEWWSSTEISLINGPFVRSLGSSRSSVIRYETDRRKGKSIRCLKDSEIAPIQGCTDGTACNFLANANQDDGSCLYQNATCDDGNANTVSDVINGECFCSGTQAIGSGLGTQVLPGNTTCANEYISVTGCGGQTSLTYDGRTYDLVEIGGQCWFADNLATDQYRNGDLISTGLDNTTWQNTTTGAFAIYNNNPVNDSIYGKLYNWYTTVDSRGLCPTGWHVPTDCEWMYLEGSLGMTVQQQEAIAFRGSNEGGAMKAITGWSNPNSGATNSSGFTALPGGYLNNDGYQEIGNRGAWLCSSYFFTVYSLIRILDFNYSMVERADDVKRNGFSVRCIKDSEIAPIQGCTDGAACNFMANANQDDGSCLYQNATCDDGNANTVSDVINGECFCSGTQAISSGLGTQVLPGNTTCASEYINVVGCNGQTSLTYDGRTYDLVEIGGQCWFADNLATDQYRNGDPIPTGLDNTTWQNTTTGAFAIYNNDPVNDSIYGKLYNWHTTVDSRGLCPTGWHVPSDCEWMYLEGSLGMSLEQQQLAGLNNRGVSVGGALKDVGFWNAPNLGATNSSGFSALPGGYRHYSASGQSFNVLGDFGAWWTSEMNGATTAWYRELYSFYSTSGRTGSQIHLGYSVRCLKDSESSPIQGCTDGAACNFMVNANQDDGSCLYQNATCDDGNENTTNDLINGGCQCAGTALAIGQDYQGGKVAYIFQPGDLGYVEGEIHGLIAAAQDFPSTVPWGCSTSLIPGADGLSIGFGFQNTLDAVAAGCGGAAQACADLFLNGYSDWFLPSINELEKLNMNRQFIGGFQSSYYWSSSQTDFSFDYSWAFLFGGFEANGRNKAYGYNVRAVRTF